MPARPPRRRPREATIALINVVFLMLVFFLIAGTVAPPLDPDLRLVETADLEGREPPDALVLAVDGALSFRGEPADPAAHLAALGDPAAVRIVPDRAVPARRLVEVAGALREAGAARVLVVSERAPR